MANFRALLLHETAKYLNILIQFHKLHVFVVVVAAIDLVSMQTLLSLNLIKLSIVFSYRFVVA